MSSNNKLYRNFIILQEDERGYANALDKTLSGYSKIEARGDMCKVSFYAQNLKKDDDDYHMVLICCKKDCKQIIDLGTISITDSGKGEMTKEYDSTNIGGIGVGFDKICGAAVVKLKDGIPIYVMCGFLNSEQPSDNWKNYKIVKTFDSKPKVVEKVTKKDDKKEHKKVIKADKEECEHKKRDDDSDESSKEISPIENKEESKPEEGSSQEVDRSENKEENSEDADSTENKESSPAEDSVENKDDSSQEANSTYIPRENLRGKFEDYEEQIENIKEFDPDTSDIRGSIGEYFENVAEGFERCKSLFKEVKYTKWYKVKVNDLYEMCNMSNYNKYTLAYYPMLNYYPYIKKHGYFMLGYKCDAQGNLKYIVYGIPGKKDKDEQPYDGKTGFVTWVSDKGKDEVGCWLMFYDFKNSTVVVPMQ